MEFIAYQWLLKVKNVNAYATDFGEWRQEHGLELINFEVELMVELADQYVLTSNRESGFGHYDEMLDTMYQVGDVQ